MTAKTLNYHCSAQKKRKLLQLLAVTKQTSPQTIVLKYNYSAKKAQVWVIAISHAEMLTPQIDRSKGVQNKVRLNVRWHRAPQMPFNESKKRRYIEGRH